MDKITRIIETIEGFNSSTLFIASPYTVYKTWSSSPNSCKDVFQDVFFLTGLARMTYMVQVNVFNVHGSTSDTFSRLPEWQAESFFKGIDAKSPGEDTLSPSHRRLSGAELLLGRHSTRG